MDKIPKKQLPKETTIKVPKIEDNTSTNKRMSFSNNRMKSITT